jgi:hypothetical protein
MNLCGRRVVRIPDLDHFFRRFGAAIATEERKDLIRDAIKAGLSSTST